MKSNILNKEFDVNIVHIGLMVNDELWQHDKWVVVINGQTFDYRTGIGHRKPLTPLYKDEFNRVKNMNPRKDKGNLMLHNDQLEKCSRPKKLDLDDVLYSLIMDSYATEETFEDWCSEYGYDADSRKAERMYNDCKENTKKLKTFIDDLDVAREKFQDY